MDEDRPRIVERVKKDASPDASRQSRSNGMLAVGALLLAFAVASMISTGGGAAGALLIGLLGAGLLVGGLVIRR